MPNEIKLDYAYFFQSEFVINKAIPSSATINSFYIYGKRKVLNYIDKTVSFTCIFVMSFSLQQGNLDDLQNLRYHVLTIPLSSLASSTNACFCMSYQSAEV